MTLNLSQLQELMSPLSELCKKEKEVDISGIKVTIRHLNPKEEIEIQKLLPSIQDEGMSGIEFADVFRRETLSRCIIKVNDLDLRDVSEIETGEVLANGTPVKVSKPEAVIRVMERWSRPVINKLFEHYGLLSEEIEQEMDESLVLSVQDTELEKENLQDRISNLDRTEKLNGIESGEKEVP